MAIVSAQSQLSANGLQRGQVKGAMRLRNTIIEDEPQVSCRRVRPVPLQSKQDPQSPMTEGSPTPRAYTSTSISSNRYDDMYDVTESESEEVEIRISNSIKRRMNGANKISRYPSLVIPSPSEWPTIEKLKSAEPMPATVKVNLPPSILERMAKRAARVPSTCSAPSLADSLSGDDGVSSSSCPSTPDLSSQQCDEQTWNMPIQLDMSSLSLLQHISPDDESQRQDGGLQISMGATEEMREVVNSPPLTARPRISTQGLQIMNASDGDDELSALSVPSPGGFFASLNTATRQDWTATEPMPSTSTAAEFYDVPFSMERAPPLPTNILVPMSKSSGDIVEHTVAVPPSLEDRKEPITAIKGSFPPPEMTKEVDEIDECYDEALKGKTEESFGRTALWIDAQDAYMKAVCETDGVADSFKKAAEEVPATPNQKTAKTMEDNSPGKKSVRFDDSSISESINSSEPTQRRISPIHDGTFWEGWRHQKRSQRARDVFQHRQARAEAEHVRRTSMPKEHAEQVKGNYSITETLRHTPSRPISFLPDATEDERQGALRQLERERQALDQMSSASWHVSAQREVNGGKLITSPQVATFKSRNDVRILDLHGQVHCSWAWNVAIEHPNAMVYTVATSDAEAHVMDSKLEGPDNHIVCAAPKAWKLPFDNDFFDVISARNMYAHLRTVWPKGHGVDEWDLTLRECQRVLKPGGYLEFHLLDAELLNPDSNGQALGVEFAFNLKTRGYDPCAGRNFLPRLKRAGFGDIKRAWMILPVADVLPRWYDSGKSNSSTSGSAYRPSLESTLSGKSNGSIASSARIPERSIGSDGSVNILPSMPVTGSTTNIRAVTGLVGSRIWEQWMLKLNSEMGRDESRCLESVAKALQAGGKTNAAWKCLVGWARKDL